MKKLLIAFVCVALLSSSNFVFAESQLTDIEGHKNQTAIEFLEFVNIVHGHPDKTFKPDDGVNRAETLKLLFEAKGGEGLVEPTVQCFPDVPLGEWYTIYVCSAFDLGYVEGYPDGNFRPADMVNKVETLKLISMFSDWDLTEGEGEDLFDDTDPEAWYADYLQYAKKKNLIEYSGNMWYPDADMPRGEIAEVIFRTALVKHLGTDAYDETDVPTYLEDFYGETPDPDPVTDCSSAENALTVVEDNFFETHPQKSRMAIYQYENKLVEDDSLAYFDENNQGQGMFVDAGEEKWVFLADHDPLQMMFHESTLATVDMNCNLEQYTTYLYPIINGEAQWDSLEEKTDSPDLVLSGDDAEDELAELIRLLTADDPRFGTCGADPNELKRAVVVWVGEDVFIKRNAVNWYTHLCNNNYITTVVTGDTATELLNNINAELAKIETESHDTGFENVHWHFSSHGMKDTGDLFVTEMITIDLAARTISLTADFVDLDDLAAKFGEKAFTVGTAGIWSDSFTIIHDTCYSGNAIPKYQAQAYIPGSRETAVGWVLTGTNSSEPGYATLLLKRGHYFTNALTQCLTSNSHSDQAAFSACVSQKIRDLFLGDVDGDPQHPQTEKLSPLTDEHVPYFP